LDPEEKYSMKDLDFLDLNDDIAILNHKRSGRNTKYPPKKPNQAIIRAFDNNGDEKQ
jgi:hypothetical protein